jgi:hypothetical protein
LPWFAKSLWEIQRPEESLDEDVYDFDLTLPLYSLHLKQVHRRFYDDFENKPQDFKDSKLSLK